MGKFLIAQLLRRRAAKEIFPLLVRMLPPADTKNPTAVATSWHGRFSTGFFLGAVPTLMDRAASAKWSLLFAGKHPGYQAIDLRYHDFEHTLASHRLSRVAARVVLASSPAKIEKLSPRQYELAMAAALLHDSGLPESALG